VPSADGLRFIAERVEGNLLAAHQEILKLAVLYPEGA
jgi:DNA polymerase-3 subunit delta